jgi:hypothetical protein
MDRPWGWSCFLWEGGLWFLRGAFPPRWSFFVLGSLLLRELPIIASWIPMLPWTVMDGQLIRISRQLQHFSYRVCACSLRRLIDAQLRARTGGFPFSNLDSPCVNFALAFCLCLSCLPLENCNIPLCFGFRTCLDDVELASLWGSIELSMKKGMWSLFENTFVHSCMGVGVFITVYLFLEICVHHGRWNDFFLSPLFIKISEHNEQWRKHPYPPMGVQNPMLIYKKISSSSSWWMCAGVSASLRPATYWN